MKSTLICVVILLATSSAACAFVPGQHWEISASYLGEFDGGSAGLWQNGWGLGIGVVQDFTPEAQLALTVSVSQHQFAAPVHSFMSPAMRGLNSEITGEDSWQYAFSLALRTFAGTRSTRGFLALRTGVTVTDVGAMMSTSWWDDSPEDRSTRALNGSSALETALYISMGAGLRVPLMGGRCLLLETAVRLTDGTRLGWVPLVASVQF